MINETEGRNLILEAIRQLDKFNVIMEDNDYGYFDNDMGLPDGIIFFWKWSKVAYKVD